MRATFLVVFLAFFLLGSFAQDCTWKGETISDGSSARAFSTDVSCNCPDVAGEVYCDAGVLSGDDTYTFKTCTLGASCYCFGTPAGDVRYGTSVPIYSAASACNCVDVGGDITCSYTGEASGNMDFTFKTCTTLSCGGSSGDPHFFGFLGQKYDVMGQSFEIYNLITSATLQINSRFIPYYKTSGQTVPTGTMMGDLGIKLANHKFYVNSNETTAILDNTEISLKQDWAFTYGDATIRNKAGRNNNYEITIENADVAVTFSRKVYIITDLEKQWHFDYFAKLYSDGTGLHGLLGQTWELKNFAEKTGAFQYLDGEEDNYRIMSNKIFGDDFTYNKFLDI